MIVGARNKPALTEDISQGSFAIYPETADIKTASEAYANRFKGKVGAWFLHIQEEAILRILRPYPKANILDIGGGHGQMTGPLIRENYTVTVLGSAEKCNARIRDFIEGGHCNFQTGNILDLPYPDGHFDVVVSFRLLAHVKHWKLFLNEASRVARKAVIIDYPELRSVNYFAPSLFIFKKRLEKSDLTRPYSCFRESEVVEIFNQKGFIRKERFAEFFLPMVFHRVLQSPKISIYLEDIFRSAGFTERFGSPVILKMVREKINQEE